MGAENDFCCEAVRKRHAQVNNLDTNGTESRKSKENGVFKEEMKKARANEKIIKKTKVSFFDFWYECIDWDMIKLFYALLMLFFCTVGFAVFFYLFYVFNFNEKLWYFYFPVSRRYRDGFWPLNQKMLPNVNFSTIHKSNLMSTEPVPVPALHDKMDSITVVEIVKNENLDALLGLSFLGCFLMSIFVYDSQVGSKG